MPVKGHQRRKWSSPYNQLRQRRETITIESSTNDATALYCMNFSGDVGHVTIFKLNVHNCVLSSSMVTVRIRVRIRFSV